MNRDGANQMLKKLQAYYPLTYPETISTARAKATVDDFEEVFAKYKVDDVLSVIYDWHLGNNRAPSVSDILSAVRGQAKFLPISADEYNHPTTWSNYFEDDDGYGYATNSKTRDIDCVWKPHWYGRKSKMRILKEHGIVSY